MTSRRKAKRAEWIYYPPNMFVVDDDGSRSPLAWPMRWYQAGGFSRGTCPISYPDPMWGCVKKTIQQKHRGSWNLIGIDTWYGKGWISWNQN